MTDVSYVPGEWTAVAGDRCWALIDAAPDSVTVREIWQRIEDGAGLDMLMVSLLRRGLREAPDFALLATHDGCSHLFCRGRGSATLSTEGTSERLTGTGLVTWREHPVTSDVVYVVLGDSPAGTDLRLPASTGVFLAQSITIALTGVSSRRTEAAAARPFAAPEASAAETAPPASMAPAASVRDAGATLSYPGADAVPDSTAARGVPMPGLSGGPATTSCSARRRCAASRRPPCVPPPTTASHWNFRRPPSPRRKLRQYRRRGAAPVVRLWAESRPTRSHLPRLARSRVPRPRVRRMAVGAPSGGRTCSSSLPEPHLPTASARPSLPCCAPVRIRARPAVRCAACAVCRCPSRTP